MSVEVLAVGAIALVAIALYAIFGGADFGGGVWDVLASGPRRAAQQDAIGHAIGPVWETNHVWLIFLIVVMFTCFPPAFADLSIGLYVPLSFVLVGIILRGAAYAFRSQTHDSSRFATFWGHVFGIASVVSPFAFGLAVGGLTVGNYAWHSPFAIAIGFFAVALCAQIAGVFLTLETSGELADDFHNRAIAATFGLAVIGAIALVVAKISSPATLALLAGPHAIVGIGIAMVLGFVVLGLLYIKQYHAARIAVAAEAIAVLAGWYAAQAPYLIPGTLRIEDAASPPSTIRAFLWLTAIGGVLLVPSLVLLFRVFKTASRANDAA
jgi:cytochrome d ubiquinol oxidase subunit II